MPEMPEVSALASFLAERLAGAEVTKLQFGGFFVLKTADPPYTSLIGRVVESVWRRGKFIIITTAPGTAGQADGNERIHLLFHLAKGGWVQFHDTLPQTKLKASKVFIEARFGFRKDNGEFGFDITEMGSFKRVAVYVVRELSEVAAVASLGPEPLEEEFDITAFRQLLGRRQQIKGLLRDQKIIAGIGNAYSDEILHKAKLSPYALAATLTPDEVNTLFASMKGILQDAMDEAAGKPPSELKDSKRASMRVHGRTGQACPVCGDTVLEVSFSESSMQYCPTCQTGGKPLADRRTSKFLK
ncbi:DNA-formamidopyrimidine glycosylase family protein [Arthrobacter sp. M4]|uniref:DNA-formamidopyrimidine glycosylase family protein n=1 Tax=Arthrobacter sp. M4 TaxID=218160 RepID=UPI001CDCF54B|nr:DNA-formamidopyrimidine glycosylase family protein [Arthrobacter sp. M4]MCA4132805.1 Fpg/Nei family DNA glycosylase [Arthrobacter sp. M4]